MYYLLGLCLALAALLTVNAVVSLLAAGLWRILARPARRWSAAARARLLFALRTFPPVGALAFVAAILIPSYLVHEPEASGEVVGAKLAILALLSSFGIVLALWRGFGAWRATKRLAGDWLRHAEPISLEGITIPAYRMPHRFPVIAVVGTFRPRLFIATQVFDSLNREEIRAALAHENAHLAVRDNLKRGLLRACRDVLAIVPCGRSLDRVWAEVSEVAADELAARAGEPVALDLASALVKIARIVPAGAKPAMPAGAFLVGEAVNGVAWRVRRLTHLAGTNCALEGRGAAVLSLALWTCLGAFFIALTLAASNTHILATTHVLIEHAVHALS